MTEWVKPSNFAGLFYPGSRNSLIRTLDTFEENAKKEITPSQEHVIGIVSPHAGYPYSGSTAALSFYHAKDQSPDTVVVF